MGRKIYGLGVFLTFAGGAGLAEISTSNHGCFALCTAVFAIGFAICVTNFIN